jgi:dihydrofolate synthase/folylpolyglutamate synthase
LSAPLDWLFGLEQFGIKFGLSNILAILEALDRPDRAFTSVHIAGTNGKGSVTAMVETALRAAGHRTGRYTSPHLIDLAERFVIDGTPVDGATLSRTVSTVRAVVDRLLEAGRLDVHPTFFEVTTAVAFELFRGAHVDIAAIEVGLGGRLDATNVVLPAAAAITSIGLDHEQYLGRTLPEIACEKAGIIKTRVPVVVGRMPDAAAEAVARIARDRRAPLVHARIGGFAGVPLALRGRHQTDNAAVAVTLLETLDARGIRVPPAAIARALRDTVWPGRLDVRRLPDGREALLDAAHNRDGAMALADFVRTSSFLNAPIVFGAMRDKDIGGMLRALVPVVGALVVTRPSNARAADPAELATWGRLAAPSLPVTCTESVADALKVAWRLSPRIVIAGSIFLLGDAMKEVGWS